MKTQTDISSIARNATLVALLAIISAGGACTTAYDSSGRQVQSVDPGAAVAGAAAAGILGYAIGRSNDNDHHRHDRRNDYYRSNSYNRRGYRGYYRR